MIVGPEAVASVGPLMGGKAANLVALGKVGLTVPPWFCVTTRAFGDQGLVAGAERHLLDRFDATFPPDTLVAVRSSAVSEDSSRHSFAGQFRTYLYVTRAMLVEAVVDVARSATAARVSTYRRALGADDGPVQTAVIVQRMIDSHVSGVLFTANPSTGDREEAVVCAAFGLGEGVAADGAEADTFLVELSSGAVRTREIVPKRRRIVFDRARGTGVTVEAVASIEGDAPALTDQQLATVVAIGRQLQDCFGRPQDVEWAIDGTGRIYILQSRPITRLDREQIFDNSNVVESYPGLTEALTFSFARAAYGAAFAAAMSRLGTPETRLRAAEPVLTNLLALIDGRVYYSLLNWYELFVLVPGCARMLPAWEKSLGVPPRRVCRAVVHRLTFGVVRRLATELVGLDRSVRRFNTNFSAAHATFRASKLEVMTAHELLELYEALSRRLLPSFAVSVINDLFVGQFYEAMRTLIARWKLGDPDVLRNDLLCGEPGLESIEPVRSMFALVQRIRDDAPFRTLFDSDRSDADTWNAIQSEAMFAELRSALAAHLEAWGDRMPEELKLETPPTRESPSILIATLRTYLASGRDFASLERREREIRQAAEAVTAERLAGHPWRRLLFSWVVGRCRKGVKHREALRLARSRAFGMVRAIFHAIGRHFVQHGLLADAMDIYVLTVEEVSSRIRGASVTSDLHALVAQRRREYESFARGCPPPRIVTHGLVHACASDPGPAPDAARDGELRGTACGGGRAHGVARVVLSPRDALDVHGAILVAPTTDPGWIYLMAAAAGLVVERGNILSHSAIVGRELGLPTVVGVRDATRRIRDGQTVEIDGRTGLIRFPQPLG